MNNSKVPFPHVGISHCEEYNVDRIIDILREHFPNVGLSADLIKNKKIVIKPNLVSAKDPSLAATTHPSFVEAVYKLLVEMGANDVILAESPGGPYNKPALSRIYKVTGMTEMADRTGLKLNYDFAYLKDKFSEGRKLKEFDIIKPIYDADIIINICKLKTHSLTGLSCAFKNLFGVIPGTLKFEMHAAFSTLESFSEMLTDLNMTLSSHKKIVSICDAVVSMEGNGPTNGSPVNTGMVFISDNATALDIVAEEFAGIPGETLYLDMSAEQLGISRTCPVELKSKLIKTVALKRPDSKSGGLLNNLSGMLGGRVARFFEPKPKVNTVKCVGCEKCVGFCPQNTISIKTKKGKRVAQIKYSNCIRCYCCQELCPSGAVDTVKNVLLRIIH